MKKKMINFLFLLMSIFTLSQTKYSIVSDSIKINYVIDIKDTIIESEISIENLSKSSIYIPITENENLYFFKLNRSLYLNAGVMNSILGYPQLGGSFRIAKIQPNDTYQRKIKIKDDFNEELTEVILSFDYIKEYETSDKLIKIGDDKFSIEAINYVKSQHSFEVKNLFQSK